MKPTTKLTAADPTEESTTIQVGGPVDPAAPKLIVDRERMSWPGPWSNEPLDVRMLSSVIIQEVQMAIMADLRTFEHDVAVRMAMGKNDYGFRVELPHGGEIVKLADKVREAVQRFDEGRTRQLEHCKQELMRLHSTATPVMMTVLCPKCGEIGKP